MSDQQAPATWPPGGVVKAQLRAFPVPTPQGWLFTAPEGGPVAYNEFMKRAWRPACEKAAIPDSEERTRPAVDKVYADRPDEGDAPAREAA
jgi:hypothetical protein